jgi:Tol biopolymer transport system component
MFVAPVAQGGGNVEIRSKSADGSGTESAVVAQQNNYHYPAWSPDGKYVTYLFGDGEKMVSLWIVPTSGDPKPVAIVQPPSAQSNLYSYRVSPDSRWVAYASDESGQTEVYITSFPEGKGKWKVSAGSGAFPSWSANSKELFYESISQDFYACTITVKASGIEVGAPQHLFNSPTPGIGAGFDAGSDGRRLLVNRVQEEAQAPLQLITNWLAEVKK